ncbi:MAG: hypothetical protein ACLU9S_07355 [Oscillospiraceae bacterium]
MDLKKPPLSCQAMGSHALWEAEAGVERSLDGLISQLEQGAFRRPLS